MNSCIRSRSSKNTCLNTTTAWLIWSDAIAQPLRRLIYDIVVEGKAFLYRRVFPIEQPELVKTALEEGEKASVKLNVLLAVQNRLEQLAKDRDREPEKRWQAHYDLMLAQTVAFQVKAYEYRALMKSIAGHPRWQNAGPRPTLVIPGSSTIPASLWHPRMIPPRNMPRPIGS